MADVWGIKITLDKVKPKPPIAATVNQVPEGMVLMVFKRHILWQDIILYAEMKKMPAEG